MSELLNNLEIFCKNIVNDKEESEEMDSIIYEDDVINVYFEIPQITTKEQKKALLEYQLEYEKRQEEALGYDDYEYILYEAIKMYFN